MPPWEAFVMGIFIGHGFTLVIWALFGEER